MIGLQNISESVIELWNGWEVRVMILLSLFLQIFLIIFGKCRQYTARKWIGNLVWLAYLSADKVATISLSIMSRSQENSKNDCASPNNALLAFWAPFLLLHLGGPSTITAFSLEDNELWKRHLFDLLVQLFVAFCILLRAWLRSCSNNAIFFVAILVFVAGFSKYVERTWVFRFASTEHLRDSSQQLVSPYHGSIIWSTFELLNDNAYFDNVIPVAIYLHEAYFLFKMLLRLYSSVILTLVQHTRTYTIIKDKSAQEAFKLIEVELGFMYDWLYTKAPMVYSPQGAILHSFCCLSSISALVAFSIIICNQSYLPKDKTVSYILLIGSIVLEIYAALVILFSDWAKLWLSKQRKPLTDSIYRGIYSSSLHSSLVSEKRWSASMAQFNIVSHCYFKISTNSLKFKLEEFFGSHETRENLNVGLKELIFGQLVDKRNKYDNTEDHNNVVKQLLTHRGEYVLGKHNCTDKFGWSVVQADFHHSLLIWHVATDICYHDDCKNYGEDANNLNSNCKMSKVISEYMAYLQFRLPLMLPKGIHELRCHMTIQEIIKLIKKFRNRSEAYTEMLRAEDQRIKERENSENHLSVLYDGCRLASSLQSLETQEQWTNGKKWVMISEVWVEILTYAASQCGWKEHAQQLSEGGELLTHVSVLMAHLGLSEQCWGLSNPFSLFGEDRSI